MSIFKEKTEDDPWVSISDLMSTLMMIFLFISVTYMIKITEDKVNIQQIADTYDKLQQSLYKDLESEFKGDLGKWNAVLDKSTLSIRFEEPDVLFTVGSAELRENFKLILDDFFPRYLKILMSDKYKNDIEEIRIEGHTSSEWIGEPSDKQAYFNNMELSQNRTRKVLEYVLSKEWESGIISWVRQRLTANGLSSSKLILSSGGEEDQAKSRRVEFRVRTNAEKSIMQIIEKE